MADTKSLKQRRREALDAAIGDSTKSTGKVSRPGVTKPQREKKPAGRYGYTVNK